MVSMDNNWTRNYSFPAQAIFTIVVSLLLYFTVVRQIRVRVNSDFIHPVFVEKAKAVNAKVVFSPRRVGIIPLGHDTPRGFGIPFGGYFWLPFTLFLIGMGTSLHSGMRTFITPILITIVHFNIYDANTFASEAIKNKV